MEVTVSRKAHFNAAHRLFNKNWSEEKNEKVFGKCNNLNYHGHNYEMIVNVTGKINPETGYVIDMGVLKKIIKDEVEEKLDHKNLNLDVDYFLNIIPSAENICIYIHKLLRKKISNDLNISVTLFETPRNFVTYPSN
jgi:6-pyruvoyltetrahydropterin/6-carboxytetrahydropterin synthase